MIPPKRAARRSPRGDRSLERPCGSRRFPRNGAARRSPRGGRSLGRPCGSRRSPRTALRAASPAGRSLGGPADLTSASPAAGPSSRVRPQTFRARISRNPPPTGTGGPRRTFHRLHVDRVLHALAKRVVQRRQDLRIHAFGPRSRTATSTRRRSPVPLACGRAGPAPGACGPHVASRRSLAGVHVRPPPGGVRRRVDVAAEQRRHVVGVAAKPHVRPPDVVAVGDVLHRHVQRRVGAERAIGDLPGIGLGVRDDSRPRSSMAIRRGPPRRTCSRRCR